VRLKYGETDCWICSFFFYFSIFVSPTAADSIDRLRASSRLLADVDERNLAGPANPSYGRDELDLPGITAGRPGLRTCVAAAAKVQLWRRPAGKKGRDIGKRRDLYWRHQGGRRLEVDGIPGRFFFRLYCRLRGRSSNNIGRWIFDPDRVIQPIYLIYLFFFSFFFFSLPNFI
jgi:hypothetical protein